MPNKRIYLFILNVEFLPFFFFGVNVKDRNNGQRVVCRYSFFFFLRQQAVSVLLLILIIGRSLMEILV